MITFSLHVQYGFHFLMFFARTPRQGAQTTIHCAVAREAEGISGKYWTDCGVKTPSKQSLDDGACKKLWEYSEEKVRL